MTDPSVCILWVATEVISNGGFLCGGGNLYTSVSQKSITALLQLINVSGTATSYPLLSERNIIVPILQQLLEVLTAVGNGSKQPG